jgi:hypothetical protein
MRYLLGIFFLCVASFSGCASDTVTVTSSGTTTTTSATIVPTSTTGASLNSIDWLNTTYPDLCQMNGGAKVTVANGLGPLSTNGVRLHVFDPIFGYITRPNQLDAVIPYGCIGHMDSGTTVLVYSGDASNPTSVGQLPLAASKYSLASVFTEGILAHKLELSGIGFSSDAVPQCCPDVWVTDTYTWNGSAFTLSGHDATMLGKQLAP